MECVAGPRLARNVASLVPNWFRMPAYAVGRKGYSTKCTGHFDSPFLHLRTAPSKCTGTPVHLGTGGSGAGDGAPQPLQRSLQPQAANPLRLGPDTPPTPPRPGLRPSPTPGGGGCIRSPVGLRRIPFCLRNQLGTRAAVSSIRPATHLHTCRFHRR